MSGADEYVRKLGKLVANLQALEFVLRLYLHETKAPPHTDFPLGLELDALRVGDRVPENAMTSYDTLGKLISRYNTAVSDPTAKVDPDIVRLRDSLAHGRISGPPTSEVLRLLKFSARDEDGAIRVAVSDAMTHEWFDAHIRRLHTLVQKVHAQTPNQRPGS